MYTQLCSRKGRGIAISRKEKKIVQLWCHTGREPLGFLIRKLNKCTCPQDPSSQAHDPVLVCPPYLHLFCFSERVAIHSLYHSWAFKSLLWQTPVPWERFARGASISFLVLLISFDRVVPTVPKISEWLVLFLPHASCPLVYVLQSEVSRDTSHYSRNTYVLLYRWYYPNLYILCCISSPLFQGSFWQKEIENISFLT